MATTLTRTTFTTSRLLEFFNEKELSMQMGHTKEWWSIALVKELIDNALDAAEIAGVSPGIEITLERDAVTICDNGPGLPVSTLERSLDYAIRVSDKSYYASPTRGQLGNALKCVWAAPFVVDGQHGRVDVETGGTLYRIDVTLNMITQQPKIEVTTGDSLVKSGTLVKIHWPEIASSLTLNPSANFYKPLSAMELISHYAAFNPHVSFTYTNQTDERENFSTPASITDWRKWAPDRPTSPHWYTPDGLRALIAAYVGHERDGGEALTVRAFVSEFAGLSSSAKQKRVTEAAGLAGEYLHDLVDGDQIAIELVTRLLAAMQNESRPIRPPTLGVIGQDHLTHWLDQNLCVADSVRYRKIAGEADGLPFVLEAALGIYQDDYSECKGEIAVGLNWSPTLNIPMSALSQLLGENRVDSFDPVFTVVHLACPRLEFTDRGKSRLDLPQEIRDGLEKAIKSITKQWKAAKRRADQEDRVRQRELEEMRKAQKRMEWSIKEAAYHVMEEAYLKASGGGAYPANARQIMYAARPLVLELTGGKSWKTSSYFTQRLLPGFLKRNPVLTDDWDVVYDDRGKLMEPHTGARVDLGTLAVRRYITNWTKAQDGLDYEPIDLPYHVDTLGPANRYRYALFVEKEGFNPLWDKINLANRYDLAIMSTKGMSVTAARRLVEELSSRDVTILVLRDFDKAGFSIVGTLRGDTWRWSYEIQPNVIDLGVRLSDVEELGLQSEPVYYRSKKDPRYNLIENGANVEECDYLVQGGRPGRWYGERVEINAMTSDELVTWLENKLEANGVERVVPDSDTLEKAYRRAWCLAAVQRAIRDTEKRLDKTDGAQAKNGNLETLVKTRLKGSALSWDEAIYHIAVKDYSKAAT